MIKIPHHIENLWPYKAGKPISELAREKGLKRIVKLASNENPNGPSPRAITAIQQALPQSHLYVDPGAFELTHAIAREFGKRPTQIVCGHGTDAIIEYILVAFSDAGDEVLTSQGTFIGIYVNTNKLGRRLVALPLKNYAFDLEAIVKAGTEKTKIIYLANPNNPTGSIFTKSQLDWFMSRVPDYVTVILDEAYCQYCDTQPEYPNGIDYEYDNLIVTRTFSKAYGLGGLRVGFAAGPERLISAIAKVKLPFEPNHLAQVGALAALTDYEFLRLTKETNARSIKRMEVGFDHLGISHIKTYCNSILLLMPTEVFAEQFFLRCLDHGLIVRHVKSFGIPEGIRINSGSDDETEFALQVIDQVYPTLKQEFAQGKVTKNETHIVHQPE
ncbi:MAG: aminotransferase class I/II-fold pyridoxal phosphate-dependent enzyme [Candidatus Zixiibacteriota bacterium]